MSDMDCSKHKKCNKKCKKTAVLCKKTTDPVNLDICGLCLGPEDDIDLYGKFFRDESQQLAVHQYCMFFASGLAQNGEDHEDFDGFLFKDIKKEIRRASKLRCTGCSGRGAATGCNVKKCKSNFHFKCGLNSFALFQFFGTFCAFCKKHRPTQERTTIDLQALHLQPVCPICLVNIDGIDHYSSLNSPCCKNAWFHKSCVQKQALANGKYYFRCAFCNNVDKFQEEMKRMGIHIPERDAIWEQNNAYADLLEQYNKCDSKLCLCPKGRSFSGKHHGMRWKLCLCNTCGQSGTHTQCQGWTDTPERWICSDCIICFPEETNKSSYDFLESSSVSVVPSPILIESACSSPVSDQEDNIPLSEWWHAQETICNNNVKTQHDSSIKEDNSQSLICKSIGSSSVGSTEVEVDVILGKQESKKGNTDYQNDSHSIPKETRGRKPKYLVPARYKKVKVKTKNKADRRAVRSMYAKRKELAKKLQEDKHLATIQNNSEIDASFSLSLPVTPESDNQDLSVVTTCPRKNIDFNNSQNDFQAFLKAVKLETELPSPVQQSVQPTYDNEQATNISQSPLTNESTTTADFPSSAHSPSELISCTAEVRHPYGKRKQGDIRGMFFPVDGKKKKRALFTCAVEDCGCQTTFKKKHSIKKRKLNTSSPTESKSITMYMSPLSGSTPDRKKRQRLSSASHQPDNLHDTPFDHGQTSEAADKSNSMYNTVTSAAKGMFMRALGSPGSPSKDCGSEAHVDDMDYDNSDSIIVTKVSKRSPGDYKHTILTDANCKLPSYKHEKHCEYHRPTSNKRCHASSDTVDPRSVIVIDDDDSDQTIEVGESDIHCSNSTEDKESSNMSNDGDSLPASCNLSNSSLQDLNEMTGTSSTIGSSVYDHLWHLECDAPNGAKKHSTPLSTSCKKQVDEVDNKKNTAIAVISECNKHEHSKQVHSKVPQKGLEMIVNNFVLKLEESQEECKTNHNSRTNDIDNNIGKDDNTNAEVLPLQNHTHRNPKAMPLQNHTHRNSGGFFSPLKRKSKAYSTKTQKLSKKGKHHNECSDEDFQTRKSNKITRKRPKKKYKGKVY